MKLIKKVISAAFLLGVALMLAALVSGVLHRVRLPQLLLLTGLSLVTVSFLVALALVVRQTRRIAAATPPSPRSSVAADVLEVLLSALMYYP